MRRSWMGAAVSLLVVAAFAASPPRVEAGFITNGSFESPDVPHGSNPVYYVGNSSITGWSIGGPAGNYVEIWDYNGLNASAYNTPYGAQWLWLGGYGSHATISQTVNGLAVGSTYQLSFAISSEWSLYPSGAVVTIDQGGTPTTQTFVDSSSAQSNWNSWSTQTWQFVATSTSATVSFAGMTTTTGYLYDTGLDNVDLTEVSSPVAAPAPPGVLLGLTGAACLAAAGLVRRRKFAVAAAA